MPLPRPERISARLNPNVNRALAGFAARWIAHRANAMAAASVSMCAASDSSASEPVAKATTTSASM